MGDRRVELNRDGDCAVVVVGMSAEKDNPLEAWLAADRFTAADLMADVLRIPKVRKFGAFPALESYVERACARSAFMKARDDQMAHFAAADIQRGSAKTMQGNSDRDPGMQP